MQLLAEQILVKPISDIIVHLKNESLVKEDWIMDWREGQARCILWQRYAVAAIFSSVFIEAKKRMKELLHEDVIYADGLTPDELAARIHMAK